MKDDLQTKKTQKQYNLKHIKAGFYAILKNSTVTSRQPDQHNNQKYIGTIKNQTKSIKFSFRGSHIPYISTTCTAL